MWKDVVFDTTEHRGADNGWLQWTAYFRSVPFEMLFRRRWICVQGKRKQRRNSIHVERDCRARPECGASLRKKTMLRGFKNDSCTAQRGIVTEFPISIRERKKKKSREHLITNIRVLGVFQSHFRLVVIRAKLRVRRFFFFFGAISQRFARAGEIRRGGENRAVSLVYTLISRFDTKRSACCRLCTAMGDSSVCVRLMFNAVVGYNVF